MSIGSAFDAFVKSYIYETLFGKNHNVEYNVDNLFTKQVEEHNRDWAWEHGKYVFQTYQDCGALADLMSELRQAVADPKFEIDVRGTIGGVPLLGKPDVYFISKMGTPVILDWKVNGYCSNHPVSPKKGYLKLRHGSKNRHLDKSQHKECFPFMFDGIYINVGMNLEDIDEDWACQLGVYGWLCGMDIGSPFVVGLDQIVCNNNAGGDYPVLRIAEHRLRVGRDYQKEIFATAKEMWGCITSGHFFKESTLEVSQNRCKALEAKAQALTDISQSTDPMDIMFKEITSR